MSKAAEVYACLYVREFPAQALLRLRPEMHGKPCVVIEGEAPMQHVCSLNTKARLLKMSHGMTRAEVDTFPQASVLPRSRKIEDAMKAILLECAGAFSPRIEDRSKDDAFLCCIDIAGTQSLFGPPEMLARNLLHRVRALGIMACITVSSNFHTAVCLAKDLLSSATIRVIPSGAEAASLASLPLSVLDLTEIQAEIFALWGIHTFGMLAALPENNLISRMGQDGKRLRQLARGELPHLFQPLELPFTLEERMELDTPIDLLESLLFGLNIMLGQLILRARARVLALASVTITLALDSASMHTRTVRPALPTNDKEIWLKLLQLDLEAHPPQASVLAVTLSAEPGSTSKVQLGLFSPQLPEPDRLDVTLARIRAIVGKHNVGRAVLQDTHAPESFRIEPLRVPAGGFCHYTTTAPTFVRTPASAARANFG
ncbi:MAG TPA: DNA polymerase Y family protein [Acidobacteriaceae bacterium]|nr:DNA polymerase Y family protein [Acidobacteriaceae bacterium]